MTARSRRSRAGDDSAAGLVSSNAHLWLGLAHCRQQIVPPPRTDVVLAPCKCRVYVYDVPLDVLVCDSKRKHHAERHDKRTRRGYFP